MADFLSAAELADLRVEILDTLPDSCVISRATLGTASPYLPDEQWAAVGTVVCRLDPFTRQDSSGMVAEREANTSYYTLTTPYDTDLRDGDRVAVNALTLEVLQRHASHSARIVSRATLAAVDS